MTLHHEHQQASSPADKKWQQMISCLSQYPAIITPDLSRQFKKMVIYRWLLENLLLFLLQYIGLMFAPIAFASGTAVGFVFLKGVSVLPGIWLGSFIAYYLVPAPLLSAASYATALSLQATLMLWFNYRFISPTLIFYRARPLFYFIIFTSLLTAVISTLLPARGLQGWLANFDGIVVIACAINAWDMYFPAIHALKRLHRIPLLLLSTLFTITLIALVLSHTISTFILIASAMIPIMAIISWLYGWCGNLAAAFVFALFINLGTFLGAPVFTMDYTLHCSLILQTLLALTTLIGMVIAVVTP